eukprot:SAG31_NODE_13393_length_872_cov_1.980595_1_plen_98_part_00
MRLGHLPGPRGERAGIAGQGSGVSIVRGVQPARLRKLQVQVRVCVDEHNAAAGWLAAYSRMRYGAGQCLFARWLVRWILGSRIGIRIQPARGAGSQQ